MVTLEATYNNGIVKEITLPQCWEDLTWNQYVELINYDTGELEKRLAILLGIEVDDVILFETELLLYCYQQIGFTYDVTALMDYNNTPKELENWYIGHQPWFKLEQCKQVLSKLDGKDIMNAGAEVVKIYTDEDITQKPVTEVLGKVSFFLNRYISFINVLLN